LITSHILAFSKIIYLFSPSRYPDRVLPNHYEVEEVSRIRREEATQRALHERLSRAPEQPDGRRWAKSRSDMGVFGGLRQRLALLFKRGAPRREGVATKSVSDYQ
jgi:hypothetical protein